MSQRYDVVVIGGGPAGYVAAIRAAQLGLKTACIDATLNARGKPSFGGTCLNVGCIPSKALLDSSHHWEFIAQHAGQHGIRIDNPSLDLETMLARKDRVVGVLTQGVSGLLRKAGVAALTGHGRLMSPTQVGFTAHGGDEETLDTRHIIIATGSRPATLPFIDTTDERVTDSTGALGFTQVPQRLGILGAGVIGLELGSVWRRLGSQVSLLEALPDFLPAVDRSVADEAFKILSQQGLDIRLNTRAKAVTTSAQGVQVALDGPQGESQLEFDRLVVAVGRRPNTEGLGLEGIGLGRDARGYIEVDDECRTSIASIWAVGDVVRGPMLAHKAMEEGVAVAERLLGQKPHIDFLHIPWVIYIWPEIAWVGETEQQLQARGARYTVGTFPFMANGRARAMGETGGFVKMLASADDDRILGVHALGPNASEYIAEAVVAMSFDASAEDLARTSHAHPSLSEAIHEAALGTSNRMLHI